MIRGLGRGALLVAPLLFVACATTTREPADPLARGEQAMQLGDLPAALCAFDEVDAGEVGYAIARLHAAAIEQRLFRQQELVLLGLRLRAEWRDEEAIAVFGEALTAWPEDVRTQQLVRGTRERLRLLERVRELANARTDEGPTPESASARSENAQPAAPAGETAPAPGPESEAKVDQGVVDLGSAARIDGDDVVGARLVVVEDKLQRGDLDESLRELAAMHEKWPGEQRVCGRYARILLQRGLLHYGRGSLERAIADWRFAQTLDPKLASLAMLIDLAQRELAQPPR